MTKKIACAALLCVLCMTGRAVAAPGDAISTGTHGKADVVLPDGSALSLDAGTAMTLLDEGVELTMGQIHAQIVHHLRKKFEVRTPTCAIAVRGTDFVVRQLPGKPTSVVVLEGTVAFSDRAGQKTVLVGAGQQSYLLPDGSPSEPSSANLREMPKWWEEP